MMDEHEYEKFLLPLNREIDEIVDYLDGLETIISQTTNEPQKHVIIYKECYQRFYAYAERLGEKIEHLLFKRHYVPGLVAKDAEFQKSVDVELATLARDHRVAKAVNEAGGRNLFGLHPVGHISNSRLAAQEYKKSCSTLNDIHNLIGTLENHLKRIYFRRTQAHLLPPHRKLLKRHEVLKLFGLSAHELVV